MSIVYTMTVPHPPLIIPEVGHGEEHDIQKTVDSYHAVMKKAASYHPDTVIIISPHSTMYADYIHISPGKKAHGDFGSFRAGQVKISCNYDEEFVEHLCQLCDTHNIPAGTLGGMRALDHGTMIPLYFLQQYDTDFKVVRIGISGLAYLEHYRLGQMINQTAEDLGRKVVIIASGDLSHKLKEDGPYGFAKEGPEFDQEVMTYLRTADFYKLLTFDYDFCESAAECGLRSFQIMAGALDGKDVSPHQYSYEGPFGVGYGVCDFEVGPEDQERLLGKKLEKHDEDVLKDIRAHEDPYVRLARATVESYIKAHKLPLVSDDLPEDMTNRKAGVFVSLHINGQLRGCIGTFKPTEKNIAVEIMHNAVSACSRDPRFNEVRPLELPHIVYSVDVLGEIEKIDDISELDPQKYGVIVSHNEKRGLLLPRLPGVSTVLEQIDIARRKAGMYDDEPCDFYRFEVVRHV